MALQKTLSLLLLLLLTLLGLGLVQPSYGKSMSDQFYWQHVDSSVTRGDDSYCNDRMQKQGMTTDSCKQLNTFIHENNSTINSICNNRSIPCKNGRKNCHKGSLRVTDCLYTGGFHPNNCKYSATASTRDVTIACERNPQNVLVPVHLDG
ncbi:PREDICTED: ribonuclease 4 [Myotis brandtii]|uniref:ribonuclease 4 n=1 Tax=Myotis brandtii TaxID=109478 RepID=UPI0003BBBDEF|nr:PREDICTED: ribonuclease 4 [Myotis brandtii]